MLFCEVAEREEFIRHVAKDKLVVVAIDGGVCVPDRKRGTAVLDRGLAEGCEKPREASRWSLALGPG